MIIMHLPSFYSKLIIGMTFVLLPCLLQAQVIDYEAEYGNSSPSQGDSTKPDLDFEKDTINFHFFYPHNPSEEYPYQDTFLNNTHIYHPARQADFDYANTGNLGSPNKPLVYQPSFHQGLDIGFHQFDLYKIDLKTFPYYRLKKSFTNLIFTQGSTQEDTYAQAEFSRNFDNRINLSLDYKRINHTGQYQSQKSEDTAFAVGLWWRSRSDRYQGFLTYVSNAMFQQDNGGIDLESVNETNIGRAISIPVHINDKQANTAHTERGVSYYQHLRLNPNRDSIMRKRAFAFSHLVNFHVDKFKFADTSPDTSYYGDLQIDNRGLRYFLRDRVLENTLTLKTYRLQNGKVNSGKKQRDFFEVGIHHELHDLFMEPVDTSVQNLYLNGRFNFFPNERLRLATYAHLGLAGNAGDYRLSGDLFFDFKKVGQLRVKAVNQLYAPCLVQHRFYVSQQETWNHSFNKTFETSLALTYALPSQKFEVSGHYHLLTDYIYFDEQAQPQQIGGVMNIGQLVLKKDFKLWRFHLNNKIVLQETSQNELRLPQLYSSHSLYYQGKIFRRVLDLQMGFDFHINNPYFADTYQPLIGQFHLQNDQEIQSYPDVDAFMNFKVNWFRFFLKWENLYNFFTEDFYYQVEGYPMPYNYLRFGLSWQFVD